MKYAFVVTALLASVAIAAGRQPQFKSGVEVVYLDVTVQAPDGSTVRGLANRVMTRHPDYRVRTRAGYRAANPK